MRAQEAKAQREAVATYAGSLCKYACNGLSNSFRLARLLAANPYAMLNGDSDHR
jgi:hypothetical protein